MLGAAVPVTTVYEHSHMRATEQQVGCSAKVSFRPRIHAIPEPAGMDEATNYQLRASVSTSIALHCPARRSTRSPGLSHRYRVPAASDAGSSQFRAFVSGEEVFA